MTSRPEDIADALAAAHAHAERYLSSLPIRPVSPEAGVPEVLEALGETLPDGPSSDAEAIDLLAEAVGPGLRAVGSGRFFGFVIGGTTPAALGADWLVTAWDQNAGLAAVTPGVVAAEHLAGRWVLELLGLPPESAVGFATGCTQAHVTCLAAARHHVLAERGWDVGERGLQGAPIVHVVAGEERHATLDVALRLIGLGTATAHLVETDDEGRMSLEGLRRVLDEIGDQPTIVNVAAGNVNTGSFDPIDEAITIAHERGAWVHVDGAFGLWAAAAPERRHLVRGVERADSWATDGHKWLNVPYDCGIAVVARPEAVRAAMGIQAPYLVQDGYAVPDPIELVPEFSRRARGVPVWAMLRASGRSGVADLVERCCRMATRAADSLARVDGVEIVNDVVINQVLVRFDDDDEVTRDVVAAVLADRSVYAGGSTFRGRAVMRISVSSWRTGEDDIDLLVDVITRCHSAVRTESSAPRL